ncbi:MAG: hypothetical protein P8X74_09365 [Reinekea sp.]|jgi:hypothetical protein
MACALCRYGVTDSGIKQGLVYRLQSNYLVQLICLKLGSIAVV